MHVLDGASVTFAAVALTYLFTGDVTRAYSIMMVDFCCALKLVMSVSVLSAMRDASNHGISVKGGKFMENLAQARTIIFDKTGTLTKAQPKVKDVIPFGGQDKLEMLRLAAVILIEDPLKDEAARAVKLLHQEGFEKVVMLTGDSQRTARAVAERIGIDDWRSEVLPEDKASYIAAEHAAGRKVVMVGDGINDSPALSAADVGIAINSGAAIAREIADVTISEDDLMALVTLKKLCTRLEQRTRGN